MAKIGRFNYRGTESELADVVLGDGEIAYEMTNKRMYIGDGTTTVSNLDPFLSGGGD